MWQSWDQPLPFIEISEGNQLSVNKEVASLLSRIEKPLVTVCINGVYRTGKSYLMNRLAGKQTGFALGSSVQSVTKGIWVWPLPHPYEEDKVLLLMDTEGLKDASKGDDTYDMWISCLSLLLSSLYIYNATGRIDSSLVDTLSFVSEMSQHIQVKLAEEIGNDTNMDEYFPTFVLAVRDFCLVPEVKNKEVTADEYMEYMMLASKSASTSNRELKRNKVKQAIRNYFPRRKCFFFSMPVADPQKLRDVEVLNVTELSPVFLQQSDEFCEYIYRSAPVKRLNHTLAVNGRVFSELASQYVKVLQCRGMVPCIESAVSIIARMENDRAVENGVKHYACTMATLDYPVTTLKIIEAHHKVYQEAVDIFLKSAFLDQGNSYHGLLQNKLNLEYEKCIKHNIDTSSQKCVKVLDILSEEFRAKCRKGRYVRPGGYREMTADLEVLKKEYKASPCKGVQAEDELQRFIAQWKMQLDAVLSSDSALTQYQKYLQAKQLDNEEMNLKLKQQQKELAEWHEHKASVLAVHKEHMSRLHEEFKKRVDDQQKTFDELLQHRTKEQEHLLKEGFKKEADKMQKAIDELNAKKIVMYWNLAAICAGVGSTVCSMLPHPAFKVVGGVLGVVAAAIKPKSEKT